jgi:hypothetical protein
MVKVINLEDGFRDSRRRVSRSFSNLVGVCVERGRGWGVFLGVAVAWGMIIGDAMVPFLSSRFEIPVFEIPVFKINI